MNVDRWERLLLSRAANVYFAAIMLTMGGWASWRLCLLFPEKIKSLLFFLLFLLFALSSMSVLSWQKKRDEKGSMIHALAAWIIGLTLSFAVYFYLGLLAADLFCFLALRMLAPFPSRIAGLSGFICGGFFTVYGALHAQKIVVRKMELSLRAGTLKEAFTPSFQGASGEDQALPNPAPLRIVLLSDLHMGALSGYRHIRELIRRAEELNPDLLIIAGDLFNGQTCRECLRLEEIADLFAGMKAGTDLGTYAVLGNHDPERGDPDFQAFLEKAKICLLDNQALSLSHLTLVGRSRLVRDQDKRKDLEELLLSVPEKRPVIVIDHDPQGIREAASLGVDLCLAGHTHQGQFFPFTWITELITGRKYFYGTGREGDTRYVISSGAGFFEIPVRVGTDSELVCIDLSLTSASVRS